MADIPWLTENRLTMDPIDRVVNEGNRQNPAEARLTTRGNAST
jgi:hypothetical protein